MTSNKTPNRLATWITLCAETTRLEESTGSGFPLGTFLPV
jgi:hypothetical protein